MDSTTTHDAPVSASLTTANADRCATCGAQFASDQRYCLECGERRGDPRMPYMNGRPPEPPVAALAPSGAARRPRSPAGTTAIAGIGTLLLAMGVGVLIGHSNNDNNQVAKTPPVQVVTVAGAGGAAATSAAAPSSSTPASTSDASAAGGSSAKDKAKGGASKTTSSKTAATKKKPTTPVVKVGSKGKGKGYTNGKFTGDFFGG